MRLVKIILLIFCLALLTFSFINCGGGGDDFISPTIISNYSLPDLSGEWRGNLLGQHFNNSGGGAGWYERKNFVIQLDGRFNFSYVASYGENGNESGRLSGISNTGIITVQNENQIQGILDSSKTVAVYTIRDNEDCTIDVITKKGSSYNQSDITGNWNLIFYSAVGVNSESKRGSISIQSNGYYNGNIISNTGNSLNISGKLTLNNDGQLSDTANVNFSGHLNLNKNFIAGTGRARNSYNEEIVLFVKESDTYAINDLKGNWNEHTFIKKINFNSHHWIRSSISIDSNTYNRNYNSSELNSGTDNGTISITSNGVINLSNFSGGIGYLNSGKSVIIFSNFDTVNNEVSLSVITKIAQ